MPTLPPETREVVLADLKTVYDEIKRAKFLLDRKDPQQLQAWNALDQADARLQGLMFYLGHTP
jgi:hypothetical protein